jgi:hypothetical protein
MTDATRVVLIVRWADRVGRACATVEDLHRTTSGEEPVRALD